MIGNKAIAESFGAEALVTYTPIAPPVFNDPNLTSLLKDCAKSLLGDEKVRDLALPSLGAEDFAELVDEVPGTMFRLGVAAPTGCAPLHNGCFSPDENSLEVGISVVFLTLMTWMQNQKTSSQNKN